MSLKEKDIKKHSWTELAYIGCQALFCVKEIKTSLVRETAIGRRHNIPNFWSLGRVPAGKAYGHLCTCPLNGSSQNLITPACILKPQAFISCKCVLICTHFFLSSYILLSRWGYFHVIFKFGFSKFFWRSFKVLHALAACYSFTVSKSHFRAFYRPTNLVL